MADSTLLVPELNEAETMGTETTPFEELLLQVRLNALLGPWGFGEYICVCVCVSVRAGIVVVYLQVC